jgi:hypothetical protein
MFGAGSTSGTLGAHVAPTATTFGKHLATTVKSWQSDFPQLVKVANHLRKEMRCLSLEEIWTCIDYYWKFEPMLSHVAPWGKEGARDLKRALLRVYGARCDRAADNLPSTRRCTLHQLLDEVRPGDVLISLNYDTVVERVASKRGLTLRFPGRELRRDVVNIIKPHGSTSWCLDLNNNTLACAHVDGAPLLNSLTEEDVARQREPLLLGAVPIKSELIQEVQSHYGTPAVFAAVSDQWRAVIATLRVTDQLIVAGYSFP